ncbi:MAG: NADH-dependent [FeFe] hydrogenase, group A6 [Peptococcaceae bacterium]|nr:NADH-dependent [FeFe] hydrogenase, group A6 [Peptococcaceae bacterium]
MSEVTLTINGNEVTVPKGSTILNAAKKLDIWIPTLCHMNLHGTEMNNKPASCRVCVVEVAGRRSLMPACATPVADGMEVVTNSNRVLQARKMIVELLISDHPKTCLTCGKSGDCELQDLAIRLDIDSVNITGKSQSTYKLDSTKSLVRDMNKCIMCRRCETMCNDVQKVGALSAVGRGFDAVIQPAFESPLLETRCTHCGQCVAVCPTGALLQKDSTWEVVEALADPDKVVVVQTAPSVRVAIGEPFGMEPGEAATGKMVTALRMIGFDYVYDTDFTADLTIMEEGTELLGRLNRFLGGDQSALPILTSCCPAWVNFLETQYPDLLDVPSTARSPQQMFGAVAKNFFAEKLNIPREKMVVVSIMPCLAKKTEADRPEFAENGNPDVDIVLSTRELARLIKLKDIDLKQLPDSEFDDPLGESTGAAVIFGSTGGVIEAAVRTAYELHTGKPLPKIDFEELRGFEGLRVAEVDVDGIMLKIAIAHGLGNAKTLMDEIRAGNPRGIHAIEVMACKGGCIGGAGQPYHHGDEQILLKRMKSIYDIDKNMPLRKSHENPSVLALYRDYYGEPGSELAHHQLHTRYVAQDKF